MKHFPAGIFVTALFAAMLIFPQAVFSGAEEGLLLWFQIIFPTLFPFLVVTSLLLSSGGLNLITRLFGGLFRRIFRVTQNGAFAVLAGFLCGYPMGAKVTADLLRAEKISDREARYLLSFCNNTSPVFIINFIVWKTFGDERLMLPTLLILIGSPVLMSFIFRRIYLKGRHPFPEPSAALKEKKTRFDFSVLDSCMMNSFEAIVKVGGYIILFSVLLSLLEELSGQHSILMAAAPALEVTNGILLLSSSVSDPGLRYAAVLGLTSFGGLCSAAQTKCMLERTGLSVIPYIIQKLATAMVTSLLSFLMLSFCLSKT